MNFIFDKIKISLFRLRYSATHIKENTFNLVYRLTPYESYKQNLVKKIEVLTVVEKNDEATLKIELTEAKNQNGAFKAKLKAWKKNAAGNLEFKEMNWLGIGDNLGAKTNNVVYSDYKIETIRKDIFDNTWRVRFTNGVEILQKEISGNLEQVWAMQMEFLIKKHFAKSAELKVKGIKCLSLIFINRVKNYIGENPIIKNLFVEKYKKVFSESNGGREPSAEQIEGVQGYYFAQTSKGEYSGAEGGQSEQKRIYELILKQKEELLSLENPVEFIFSHSALGVGWDNPNVFNIATLSTSYSEIKNGRKSGAGFGFALIKKASAFMTDRTQPPKNA